MASSNDSGVDDSGRYGRYLAKDWFPDVRKYDPKITVEQWVEMLNDPSVVNDNGLKVLKRLKDIGGQASTAMLSDRYGLKPTFYNSVSSSTGRRVQARTNCPILEDETDASKYWPVLYLGRKAHKDERGSFLWRVRPELARALDQIDLSAIPLYEEPEEQEQEHRDAGDAPAASESYKKADFLREVFVSEADYERMAETLKHKQNIILQGAPGVGKTFAARRLAWSLMGKVDDDRVRFVQFHQNYSYEDFIIGYKPDGEGFSLRKGVFYEFCERASNDPDHEYYFIIDEINRGNMSKIFGELLMLIEKDYRGYPLTLAYTGEEFTVPKNVFIIGMMNTADRSLAMIDYALRRRFSFIEMKPGFESDGFQKYQRALANESLDSLVDCVRQLNAEITTDPSLGRGFQIGHSYLCGQESATQSWLALVVDYDIVPMLEEYWFDDEVKLQDWTTRLHTAIVR